MASPRVDTELHRTHAWCMRTTLDLDDRLLARARKVAREQGTTLTALIEQALAAALAKGPRRTERFKLSWTPVSGRYLGGVDVADRNALYDVMGEE